MTNRILLTGAEGFTGAHFIEAARGAGYEIHSLAAGLTDVNVLNAEVASVAPDYVVHLAGISLVTHDDEEAFYRVNLFGTMNLLRALAALPKAPRSILLASSANVYGNTDKSPIEESCCAVPVNHYAMSKLAMEHMAGTLGARLPLVIARPFNYTGVGQMTSFVIPKIVEHFARRADSIELGNLEVEREFNDVRTVCEAYLRLLRAGQPGQTYNVCSGRPVSLMSVIEIMKRISGHAIQVKVNPAFVRANELHRLCGSPARLEACIGTLEHPTLEDTLRWMLSAA